MKRTKKYHPIFLPVARCGVKPRLSRANLQDDKSQEVILPVVHPASSSCQFASSSCQFILPVHPASSSCQFILPVHPASSSCQLLAALRLVDWLKFQPIGHKLHPASYAPSVFAETPKMAFLVLPPLQRRLSKVEFDFAGLLCRKAKNANCIASILRRLQTPITILYMRAKMRP